MSAMWGPAFEAEMDYRRTSLLRSAEQARQRTRWGRLSRRSRAADSPPAVAAGDRRYVRCTARMADSPPVR